MSLNTESILLSIASSPELVKPHKDWGYYIEAPFAAIKEIGLIEAEGQLELSLYFGETQRQSEAFYGSRINLDVLEKEWYKYCNFHFSDSFRNRIWFQTPHSTTIEQYISFWKNHVNLLHQHTREQAEELIKFLSKENIVLLDSTKQNEFRNKILEKKYPALNVCAGIGIIYPISYERANELQAQGRLKDLLKKKITEGLSIIGENGRLILNGDPDGL